MLNEGGKFFVHSRPGGQIFGGFQKFPTFFFIAHSSHQLILVEILARDGVGCLFSSFLRANSKRIHFSSKEAKNIFSITLV